MLNLRIHDRINFYIFFLIPFQQCLTVSLPLLLLDLFLNILFFWCYCKWIVFLILFLTAHGYREMQLIFFFSILILILQPCWIYLWSCTLILILFKNFFNILSFHLLELYIYIHQPPSALYFKQRIWSLQKGSNWSKDAQQWNRDL